MPHYSPTQLYTSYTLAAAATQNPRLTCEGEVFKSKKALLLPTTLAHVIQSHPPLSLEHLEAWLDLLAVWQGMNPQSRQTLSHVEYESDGWFAASNSG